ncbi:MAG: LacI family DNA-binding transcriptional regulator [Phycisphaeraceae bacterium JB051]
MAVTLKNVAQRAGLSWQTVSKVLNDQGHLFRPETRQRVLTAAREMGYVPNAAARAIRSKQTRQIGLLLRNEDGHRFHNLAAFVLLLGINSRLESEGYLLSVVRVGDVGGKRQTKSRVFEERVLDGLIAFSQFSDEVVHWVSEQIPNSIWVDSNRDTTSNCLRRDEKHVGQLVAKHILNLGYRKVLWAGDTPTDTSHFSQVDRHDAIEQIVTERGVAFERLDSWHKPEQKRWIYTQLPELLKPDTVVAAYNVHAANAVMVTAASLGLTIGRDYGLICCDETPEVFETWPGLCRVANDRFEMGYQAADMMLEVLSNKSHTVPSRRHQGQWVIGNTAWGPGR